MSGYDFLSGFLGSIGGQMKDKETRRLALEDEERADKRALSREEALAASRERQIIAAEARQRKNTPPAMRQFSENGKLRQVPSRYFDGKYNDEGTPEDVPQSPLGKAYNANGRLMQPMNFGAPVDQGESDAGMNNRGATARASMNNAAATARASMNNASDDARATANNANRLQVAGMGGSGDIEKPTTLQKAQVAALRNFDKLDSGLQARAVKSMGLNPGASREEIVAKLKAREASYYEPPAASALPSTTSEITAAVDETMANDPSAKGASRAAIEAYLRAEGKIR